MCPRGSILRPGSSLQDRSTRYKASVGRNLKPQFFPKCLAALEALEELFGDAHNNRSDADAFRFGPFLERKPDLCARVEELKVGQFHAGLACLLDFDVFRGQPGSRKRQFWHHCQHGERGDNRETTSDPY